jgi:3-dehydroquinate dehydratase-1
MQCKSFEVRGVSIGVGIPKICVPIVSSCEEQIVKQAVEIAACPWADMAEWRVDHWHHPFSQEQLCNTLKALRVALNDKPLLFTFRTQREGGQWQPQWNEYEDLCVWAAQSGMVDLVDVEAFFDEKKTPQLTQKLQRAGCRVVLSHHSFEGTPEWEELLWRFTLMQAAGGDVLKVAVMPHSPRDVLALLQVTQAAREMSDRPIITMSMAGQGVLSRISGELFGSAVTFGSLGQASAPGQLPAQQLHHILHILHDAGMEG